MPLQLSVPASSVGGESSIVRAADRYTTLDDISYMLVTPESFARSRNCDQPGLKECGL